MSGSGGLVPYFMVLNMYACNKTPIKYISSAIIEKFYQNNVSQIHACISSNAIYDLKSTYKMPAVKDIILMHDCYSGVPT